MKEGGGWKIIMNKRNKGRGYFGDFAATHRLYWSLIGGRQKIEQIGRDVICRFCLTKACVTFFSDFWVVVFQCTTNKSRFFFEMLVVRMFLNFKGCVFHEHRFNTHIYVCFYNVQP